MPDATVRLGYNDADVKAGLSRTASNAKTVAKQFESSFTTSFSKIRGGWTALIGTLGGLGLFSAIKGSTDELDRIGTLAIQLDASAESLQRLANMAAVADTDIETVAKSLNRINRELAKGEGVEIFDQLGISLDEYLAKEPDKQALMLRDAFSKAKSEGRGLVEIYDLMGKSASELIPLLTENPDTLRRAAAQPVASQGRVNQIKEGYDRFAMGGRYWDTIVGIGAGQFADDFTNLQQGDHSSAPDPALAAKRAQVARDAYLSKQPTAAEVAPSLARNPHSIHGYSSGGSLEKKMDQLLRSNQNNEKHLSKLAEGL